MSGGSSRTVDGMSQLFGGMAAGLGRGLEQAVRNVAAAQNAAATPGGQGSRSERHGGPAANWLDAAGTVAAEVLRSATAAGQSHANGSTAAAPPTRDHDASQGDPAGALGQLFAGLGSELQHVFQDVVTSVEQPSQPPTSEAELHSLPTIKVTSKDIKNEQDSECVVCLEKFQLGDAATRIPCGHLFHESCVKTWLASSNQCPICRFELPTDNTFYEQKRQRRAIRLRLADLSSRSLRELRHLAEHLNIDVTGCLEKEEVVQRIATSGRVDIIPEEQPHPDEPDKMPNASPMLSRSQLRSMRVGDIKAEMRRLGVDTKGCLEKEELIDRLAFSGCISMSDS